MKINLYQLKTQYVRTNISYKEIMLLLLTFTQILWIFGDLLILLYNVYVVCTACTWHSSCKSVLMIGTSVSELMFTDTKNYKY